jgi:hypothetical protein
VDTGYREQEERKSTAKVPGQREESPEVRRVQSLSTTELVARIRELLPVIYNTPSQIEFHRAMLNLMNAVVELDAKMTNGGGMPEQWKLPDDQYWGHRP